MALGEDAAVDDSSRHVLVTPAPMKVRSTVSSFSGGVNVYSASCGELVNPLETIMQCGYLRCREFALARLKTLLERNAEKGQGMLEYALVLVFIAIVVIVVLTTVGKRVNNVFSNVSKGLSS